jgi:hypothetical protein
MKVGDLVRRKDTIDPRIGIVEEARLNKSDGKVLTIVRWHTGQYGHYWAEHLEALCK